MSQMYGFTHLETMRDIVNEHSEALRKETAVENALRDRQAEQAAAQATRKRWVPDHSHSLAGTAHILGAMLHGHVHVRLPHTHVGHRR